MKARTDTILVRFSRLNFHARTRQTDAARQLLRAGPAVPQSARQPGTLPDPSPSPLLRWSGPGPRGRSVGATLAVRVGGGGRLAHVAEAVDDVPELLPAPPRTASRRATQSLTTPQTRPHSRHNTGRRARSADVRDAGRRPAQSRPRRTGAGSRACPARPAEASRAPVPGFMWLADKLEGCGEARGLRRRRRGQGREGGGGMGGSACRGS